MLEDYLQVTDVRSKILLSTVELFKRFGFKSVTMDDIARHAGISKKTLYQYFDNKNKVITAALDWYKDTLCSHCDRLMADASDAVEGFVRVKANFDNVFKEVNPLSIYELQRFYPEGYRQFRSNMERDVESIRRNLEQGVAEGNYRDDFDPEILSRFHIESSLMIVMPNMLMKDKFDMYRVNHEITEHFMRGILTAKGEKLYRKYKEQYYKH
ncbi:MAG: TetR/AcrR family transcriptional regulator [Chitinophagaceae bacterium]